MYNYFRPTRPTHAVLRDGKPIKYLWSINKARNYADQISGCLFGDQTIEILDVNTGVIERRY